MSTLDSRITGTTTRATLRANSRAAQWRSSWALAIRMARRDAWRHKGRSLLVLVMIALPVLLLTGGVTLLATRDLSPIERIPARMGAAAGVVESFYPDALVQDPAGESMMCRDTCPKAKPLPGGVTDRSPAAAQAKALEELLHTTVVPFARGGSSVDVGERRIGVAELFADAANPAFRGMVDLTGGRWAKGPEEVVVTESGVQQGLPTSGTVSLIERGPRGATTSTYTVVGTATTAAGDQTAIIRDRATTADSASFLLVRNTPITWEQARAANAYGVAVGSRHVIENPPADDPLNGSGAPQGTDTTLVALLVAALFIVSALLAGPAFAVIAQRQRHTLATAATNGATSRQLRRTVLGQALVLGVLGSIVAAAAGLALAPVAMRLVQRWRPTTVWGPFDVPVAQVAIVLGCAWVSTLAAALLPARGLGRLDVMAALRGEVSPRPARRWVPVLGLALAVLGTATTWWAFRRLVDDNRGDTMTSVLVVGGALTLAVGALLTVPMVLVLVGRLAASTPAPVRMAARDNARQRGRATPTVAAVMAGAILFAGLAIGFASWDHYGQRTYRPRLAAGWSSVDSIDATDPHALPNTLRVLHEVAPDARLLRLDHGSAHREEPLPPGPTPDSAQVVTVVTSPGCTAQQIVQYDTRCHGATLGGLSNGIAPDIRVVDPDQMAAFVPLPAALLDALRRGEMLTNVPGLQGRLAVTRLTQPEPQTPTYDPAEGLWAGTPRGTVVAHPLAGTPLADAQVNMSPLAIVSPAGAKALGAVDITPGGLYLRGEQPLTDAQRETIVQRLDVYPDFVYTERGYVSPVRGLQWLLFGVVLALSLVAVVTATALSIGEARRDLATLAAIGAKSRVRRLLAAAQAALLAGTGTALGLVVGAVPGSIWADYATRHRNHDGTTSDLVVPWLPMVGMLVVVPLLAALIASLLTRREPSLQRRRA